MKNGENRTRGLHFSSAKTLPEDCVCPLPKLSFSSRAPRITHDQEHDHEQDLILKCDSNQNMWLGYMLKVADPFYPFFFFFTIISASEEDQKIKEIEKS